MDWETIGKIINSRVGLVVLFIAYTSSPWGLGAKIDNIIRNLDRVLITMNAGDQLDAENNGLLIRMEERMRLECKTTSRGKLEVAKR